MRIKINVDIKIGRVVKYLVLSDLFLLLGWGFIEPILSVFIVERIVGATLVTVGIAVALYWILKSLLQLPIANWLDRDRPPGEKRDFAALVWGLLIAGVSALAFAIVRTPLQLYLVQGIHAVAFALYIPSWSSIFSRHLDHDRVSFDWSLDSTVAGFASGVSGLVAGVMAAAWGFVAVFVAGGVFSLVAAAVIIAVPDIVRPPKPPATPPPAAPASKPEAAKPLPQVQLKDKTPAAGGI